MHLLKMVGVTLGLLPALALVPGVPEVNLTGYEAKLHMQMWANFSRKEKEREWAEKQPCISYEQTADKEMEETAPGTGTGGDLVYNTVEETYERSVEISVQDLQDATVASEDQSSATPLYQINTPDGPCTMDTEIQEYLYKKLADAGIPWFMPYAICQIYQESRFDPVAVSPNGRDRGILQYRVEFYSGLDWTNPCAEIDLYVQQMADRTMSGKTVSEMISCHMMSDFGDYNQAYVDAVMSHSGSLVRVR